MTQNRAKFQGQKELTDSQKKKDILAFKTSKKEQKALIFKETKNVQYTALIRPINNYTLY